MRRVLVTRPQPGASATAERLRARGHEPVVLSLTEIVATPSAWPPANGIAAVLMTSANAARRAPPEAIARFRHLPVFAVGARTAAAARAAGFADVQGCGGDAEALAAQVESMFTESEAFLLVTGRPRKSTLERRLEASGHRVVAAETYLARTIERDEDALSAALGTTPVEAALVYSARAAELLCALMERSPSTRRALRGARIICISPGAALPLQPIAAPRIIVAGRPDEEHMLALLEPGA